MKLTLTDQQKAILILALTYVIANHFELVEFFDANEDEEIATDDYTGKVPSEEDFQALLDMLTGA